MEQRSIFWICAEYYWLRFREIFDRKMSRKLIWQLYWEATKRIEDLKLRKAQSKNQAKEIRKGLDLCRKIREHILVVEGGKKR